MMIGEGESWGIFGWIWVCTDVRDVGTKGSVEGPSAGPIFVIRPLPWQVRLHGRSKKYLNKKITIFGSEGRQHGVYFCPGSPLRCVVCVLCPFLLFCLLFSLAPNCKQSDMDSGQLQPHRNLVAKGINLFQLISSI